MNKVIVLIQKHWKDNDGLPWYNMCNHENDVKQGY